MFRSYSLRQKEIINIKTAERLGYMCDVEIDEHGGNIEAIVVRRRGAFWQHLFGGGELVIPWSAVEVVGEEIILVKFFTQEHEKLT